MSPSKRGGPGGGPTLGPMLKSLHRGPKRGIRTPPPPPPTGSAHDSNIKNVNAHRFICRSHLPQKTRHSEDKINNE